ncbi:MAG: hypothetical protein JWR09_5548 [Mucilaginibacter sp.]|nr:hypothetical protein [Mucilaginibacter sp.]
METKNIELIIEKGEKGVWGRVNYNDNLITEEAGNLNDLELKLKELLHDFEDVDPESISFDLKYDVYSLFEQFDFLNISKVAKYAGIHPGLLRQYASGVKHPSLTQVKKIEETLHRLAGQMQKASVYAL